MGTNKIYRVTRMKRGEKFTPEPIYTGRIRDCKKYIQGTELTYKEYGYETITTTFQVIILINNIPECFYMITEA